MRISSEQQQLLNVEDTGNYVSAIITAIHTQTNENINRLLTLIFSKMQANGHQQTVLS